MFSILINTCKRTCVYLLFLVYFLLQIKIRASQLFIKAYAVTRCKKRRCYESWCHYLSPGHDLKGVLVCPSTLPSSVSISAWLSRLTNDVLGWGADRDGTDPSHFHGCLVAKRVEWSGSWEEIFKQDSGCARSLKLAKRARPTERPSRSVCLSHAHLHASRAGRRG